MKTGVMGTKNIDISLLKLMDRNFLVLLCYNCAIYIPILNCYVVEIAHNFSSYVMEND